MSKNKNKNFKNNGEMLSMNVNETEFMPNELKNKIESHKELCDFIHNLYITKNRDYGDSMHPLYEKYGLTAFLVLFGIKISRVESLMEKGNATYESLEDSLLDLANYAMMAVTELRAEKAQSICSTDNFNKDDLLNAIQNSTNTLFTTE